MGTALRNLKKANEARRKGKRQKAPDDWEARSRVRLERIIEKAERELNNSDTMDGVDVAKLTNVLKVCHRAHGAMKDGGDAQLRFLPQHGLEDPRGVLRSRGGHI